MRFQVVCIGVCLHFFLCFSESLFTHFRTHTHTHTHTYSQGRLRRVHGRVRSLRYQDNLDRCCRARAQWCCAGVFATRRFVHSPLSSYPFLTPSSPLSIPSVIDTAHNPLSATSFINFTCHSCHPMSPEFHSKQRNGCICASHCRCVQHKQA